MIAIVVVAAIVAGITYIAVPKEEVVEDGGDGGGEKVTIEVWESWAGEPAEEALISAAELYSDLNPSVDVNVVGYTGGEYWTKLRSSMAAGQPPDIYCTYGGGETWGYMKNDMALPVDNVLDEDWAEFVPGTLNGVEFNGNHYGLPYEMFCRWIWVNSDLFQQADLEVPEDGWTWEEFKDAITTLKSEGITPIGLGGKTAWHCSYWYNYLLQRVAGHDAVLAAMEGERDFTEDVFVEAYEKMAELRELEPFQEGYKSADFWAGAWASFGNGDVAMMLEASWAAGTIEQHGTNYELVPFPTFSDGEGNQEAVHGQATYLALGPAGHSEEALDFIEFLFHKILLTHHAIVGKCPMGSATDLPPGTLPAEVMQAVGRRDNAPLVTGSYGSLAPPKLGSVFDDTAPAVLTGNWTPEKACEELEAGQESVASENMPSY